MDTDSDSSVDTRTPHSFSPSRLGMLANFPNCEEIVRTVKSFLTRTLCVLSGSAHSRTFSHTHRTRMPNDSSPLVGGVALGGLALFLYLQGRDGHQPRAALPPGRVAVTTPAAPGQSFDPARSGVVSVNCVQGSGDPRRYGGQRTAPRCKSKSLERERLFIRVHSEPDAFFRGRRCEAVFG